MRVVTSYKFNLHLLFSKINPPPRPRYFILMSQLPYTALAHGQRGIRGLRGKLLKATPRCVSSVAKLRMQRIIEHVNSKCETTVTKRLKHFVVNWQVYRQTQPITQLVNLDLANPGQLAGVLSLQVDSWDKTTPYSKFCVSINLAQFSRQMVKSLCPLHLRGFTRIMKEAFKYALTGKESRLLCKGGQGFEVGNTEKQI